MFIRLASRQFPAVKTDFTKHASLHRSFSSAETLAHLRLLPRRQQRPRASHLQNLRRRT